MDVIRLGLSFRALRRHKGWSQRRLAAKAEVSRSLVQRLERGGVEDINPRAVRAVAEALGARFELRLLWQGEALDRLLDGDHARLVEEVVRWLRSEGWEVVPEATFAIYGERGSIDVLAFHPGTGALLVVEVKTVVPDLQGMLATLDRKVRLAPQVAKDRGWVATHTSRMLVLPDESTPRRRVAAHRATLDTVMAGRTLAARRWARNPMAAFGGIVFLPPAPGSGGRLRVAPEPDEPDEPGEPDESDEPGEPDEPGESDEPWGDEPARGGTR